MQELGAQVLRRAATMRTLSAHLLLLLAACVQLIWGNGYDMPTGLMLLLLLLAGCHYLPVERWNESARQWAYPARWRKAALTRPPKDKRYSRQSSTLFCLFGAICSWAAIANQPANSEPRPGFIAVTGLLLIFAWLTKPEEEASSFKIAPAMLTLCSFCIWKMGMGEAFVVLSLAACWNGLAYAAQVELWGNIIGIFWLLTSMMAMLMGGDFALNTIAVCVPWLLYAFARKKSAGYAMAAIAVAALSLPPGHAKHQMLWTGIVAALWILLGIAMQYGANRMTQKYNSFHQ
jgi:hypothetical protein